MAMQNVESKKEEFQKYLEKAGVVDALTKGARWSHDFSFHIILKKNAISHFFIFFI